MKTSPTPLPDILFERLPALQRPLLNKFYKLHRSPMRSSTEQAWVARSGDIVAALNLSPVADGYWLTGLFTDPTVRGRGVAGALIHKVREQHAGSIWLFCQPTLTDFYARLGFHRCDDLPAPLGERLQRYQRSRELVAMTHSGTEPGR